MKGVFPRVFALASSIAVLLLVSLTPARGAAPAPLNQLEAVRLESTATGTRLVVELKNSATPTFFVLERPRRAVVDFPRTMARDALRLPAPGGVVRAVRTGPQANGDLRLVLELDPSARIDWGASDRPQRRFEFALQPSSLQGGAAVSVPAIAAAAGPAASTSAAPSAAPSTASVVSVAPAALTPVKTEHAPPAEGRDVVVAIDAGHGGQDPGAIGRGGTREKDVVLDISRQLAERISREPGMRAILTRDGDYFLTLRQRIKRAREAGAQLFVSVHADSVRDPRVSGSSVYVLSLKGATDEQARLLADRENAADLAGGVSLEDKDPVIASVLVDLAQSAQISQSMVAAERVLRSLGRVNDVRKPQVQQAGFVVLKSPDIPSMLVETAFISSPADERLLGKADRREALAEAIFDGVKQYFVDHPPDGSRFARLRNEQRKVLATAAESVERNAGNL